MKTNYDKKEICKTIVGKTVLVGEHCWDDGIKIGFTDGSILYIESGRSLTSSVDDPTTRLDVILKEPK